MECWSNGVVLWLRQYSITPLLHFSAFDLDLAFEYKLRRASESDVSKLTVCRAGSRCGDRRRVDLIEAHLQFVAAAHKHTNRSIDIFHRGKNERAGDDTGPAGERLVFDAAFVSADRNLFRAPFLDEIYIR